MRVLLSGSHGLIGNALRERLEGEGHVVVPLVRPTPAGGRSDGGGLTGSGGRDTGTPGTGPPTVAWQPADAVVDRAALVRHGPYDAVVHLAGAGIGDHRWTPAYRREILLSRTEPTRLLATVTTSLDPAPGVFLSASAVGYYGDRGAEILSEDSPPGQGFLAGVCKQWEEATTPAQGATRVAQLRSGIVLSRRGGALAKQLPLFRIGAGGRLGTGRQYVSWISLEDEVSAILRILGDGSLAGPVNATAPNPVTNAELTAAISRAVHRPAVLAIPKPALSMVMGGAMASEMLLAGQRAVPSLLTATGFNFAHADIDTALRAALDTSP